MNAVITGATKGIGAAISRKFAENNFNLIISSRNQSELEAFRSELLQLNEKIQVNIFVADLSDKQQTFALGDFALKTFERIDVLVNNAGIFLSGLIMEEDDGAMETMMETNLYSAYHLTRKIAPQMMQQKSGFIINMASIASFMAYPGGGSYSISKFAMRGMSKVLREELKAYGIKVTTVMPGATWSNSWDGVDLPVERLMQATDIAESIWSVFNLSDSAVIEEIIIRPQLGDL